MITPSWPCGVTDGLPARHLLPRGGAERHPARRAAGAPGPRAQPRLRRHRRGVDLLRRARDGRHVRHPLRPQGRGAVPAGGAPRHPADRGGGRASPPSRHPAGARFRPDQPASRHRRGAVLPPGRRYHGLRGRVPEHRHPPRLSEPLRHVLLLGPHRHLRGGARRHAGAVAVPDPDLHGHGDPGDLAGPADHAADGRRPAQGLPRHLGDRRRPRRARRRPDGAAIRHLSADRAAVRAADLHDLRAWRPRQHDGRLRRRLHHQPVHRHRRLVLRDRMGLRHRLPVLHGGDLHPPARPVREAGVIRISRPALIGLAALVALPFLVRFLFASSEKYYLHILIQILIWSFIYTGWSLMGRFGLTSLGHGAFTGIGAYTSVLLWNILGLTPWLGIPIGVALAAAVALLVGYPCFRLRITGHYFALLTLALTEFIRLCIVGLRDYTGGSLGTQPARAGGGVSHHALQFEPDRVLSYYIALALWAFGLYVWLRVDRSMDRYALDAASQDEDAAASVGIDVTREKLKVTALSAGMCALGGAVYGQYQMYIGPETIAGLGVSLNIVFAVIAGGLWTLLGPTVGAVFTQLLSESLRVGIQGSAFLKDWLGSAALALDTAVYGLLLILFIIYMPKGILGTIMEWRGKNRGPGAIVSSASPRAPP